MDMIIAMLGLNFRRTEEPFDRKRTMKIRHCVTRTWITQKRVSTPHEGFQPYDGT